MPRDERLDGFMLKPALILGDPAFQAMEPGAQRAYLVLFLNLWGQKEPGVIPDSDYALAAASWTGLEEWRRIRDQVGAALDTAGRPGFWTSPGLVETHKAQSEWIERQRNAGRKGGKAARRNLMERASGDPGGDLFGPAEGTRTRTQEPDTATPSLAVGRGNGAASGAPPASSGFALPLNDGSDLDLPASMVAEFRALYGAVNVDEALREMRGYLLSLPRNRRKTRRGILVFVNRGLARLQDRAATAGGARHHRTAADDRARAGAGARLEDAKVFGRVPGVKP